MAGVAVLDVPGQRFDPAVQDLRTGGLRVLLDERGDLRVRSGVLAGEVSLSVSAITSGSSGIIGAPTGIRRLLCVGRGRR